MAENNDLRWRYPEGMAEYLRHRCTLQQGRTILAHTLRGAPTKTSRPGEIPGVDF